MDIQKVYNLQGLVHYLTRSRLKQYWYIGATIDGYVDEWSNFDPKLQQCLCTQFNSHHHNHVIPTAKLTYHLLSFPSTMCSRNYAIRNLELKGVLKYAQSASDDDLLDLRIDLFESYTRLAQIYPDQSIYELCSTQDWKMNWTHRTKGIALRLSRLVLVKSIIQAIPNTATKG